MSLDSVELLMEFEKHFDIEIPDIEAEKMYTVQQVVDYIYTVKSNEKIDKVLVEQDVIKLTSEKTGIPIHKIELYHSFTSDLGID